MRTSAVGMLLAGMLLAMTGAFAQSTTLNGPGLGFMYDPVDRSVRPVVGFPGAAYLGAASIAQVDAASVAPNGTAALVLRGGTLSSIPDITRPANVVALSSGPAAWDLIAWSADSQTAAIYSTASKQLWIVRNIASAATIDSPIDLSALPGTLSALAINANAGLIALGISDPATGGLYLAAAGQAPNLVAAGKNFSAAAFDQTGQILYGADRDSRTVWSMSGGSAHVVAASGDAVAAAVLPGGQTLAVANSADRSVQFFDVTSGTLTDTVALDIAPVTLNPLVSGIFQLNARSAQQSPAFILQAGSPHAAYFVPAQ